MTTLRIGTRGSPLARWQAEWVAAALGNRGVSTELITIVTQGDREKGAIGALGGSGLFTKEIQRWLVEERIDVAVHSLKDVPTDEIPGLCLAAVPERAPPWDVLISRTGQKVDELPPGAVVGTGSLRRRAQILYARPDFTLEGLRGNVDTRLRRLREGRFDAIVLAQAGLERLGLFGEVAEVLSQDIVLPAVGQGALGLETRCDDTATRSALGLLDDVASHTAVLAERAMLKHLRGGCLAPVAGFARCNGLRVELIGRVLAVDGSRRLEATLEGDQGDPAGLGIRVAESLLIQGAADLIQAARTPPPEG